MYAQAPPAHFRHPLTFASGQCQPEAEVGLYPSQVWHFAHVQVEGGWGLARVQALANGDFRFLFARTDMCDLADLYARRWGIEQCF